MKRLYRSSRNAVIGGVCAGVADYFQVDPTIVRLVWAATILLGGTGLIAYVLAWLVIPPAPREELQGDWPRIEPVPVEPAESGEGAGDAAVEPSVAPAPPSPPPPGASRGPGLSGPSTLGLILVLVGAFLLARNLLPDLHLQRFWPLAIVVLGLYLVLSAVRGDR